MDHIVFISSPSLLRKCGWKDPLPKSVGAVPKMWLRWAREYRAKQGGDGKAYMDTPDGLVSYLLVSR